MITRFEYHTGEIVITQGTFGDGFYILKSGAVDIVRNQQVIATLINPGSIFGEIAFLLNDQRTASVVARSPSEILRINGESLEDITAKHPTIVATLLVTLAKRLKEMTEKMPK